MTLNGCAGSFDQSAGSGGGGTDGNIYNAAGIACVVISTGMEDVHTPSERIAVADMVGGTELLMAVVRRLAAE